MAQRLEFICRAADQASFYALSRANNDNLDRSLYHTAYLISLITGVFEDLAWFAAALYGINENKMGVSIRKFTDNRANDRFFSAIHAVNPSLFSLLSNNAFQIRLNLFYPVRNLLHHGLFIQGIRLMGSRDGIRFVIPTEATEFMRNLEGADYKSLWGVEPFIDNYYVDPHKFVSRAVEIAAYVVNEVLNAFDWDTLVTQLPEQQEQKVRSSWSEFRAGVAHLLKWGVEPIYF